MQPYAYIVEKYSDCARLQVASRSGPLVCILLETNLSGIKRRLPENNWILSHLVNEECKSGMIFVALRDSQINDITSFLRTFQKAKLVYENF